MKNDIFAQIIESFTALIDENGPEYPTEHPMGLVKRLVQDCGETPVVGALYFVALNGIFSDAMSEDATEETLAEIIQKKCSFKKDYAVKLAEISMQVYSKQHLAGLRGKRGSSFEKLCGLSDWTFSWNGETEWHSRGGYVTCTGEGTASLKVRGRKKLETAVAKMLPSYEYATIDQLEEYIAKKLRERLDGAFEDYCNADDYYEPVAEDFEFEYYLTEFCKDLGLRVIATDYDGEISDYELEHY